MRVDETTDIGRRSLVKGAAWTMPLVAVGVAAPAYAASKPCTTKAVVNLSTLQIGSMPTSLTFSGSQIKADLTYDSGNGLNHYADKTPGDTGTVQNSESGQAFRYLKLHHPAGMKTGDYILFSAQFTQPVRGLSIKLVDIDKDTDEWIDEVIVMPNTFTADTANNYVVGDGKTSDTRFKSNHEGGIGTGDPLGHRTLTWADPVSLLTVTYLATDKENGSGIGQHIGVTQISFDAC